MAIDPGSANVGICIISIRKNTFNIEDMIQIRMQSRESCGQDMRLVDILNAIENLVIRYGIKVCVMESAAYFRGINKAYGEYMLYQYIGSITAMLISNKVKIHKMIYSTLQKILLGKAKRKKNKEHIRYIMPMLHANKHIQKNCYDATDALGYAYAFFLNGQNS